MAAQLKGVTQPRLYTPPLRPLTRRTTLGYEVADFAEAIGEPFLPWQRWAAIHALETVPGGDFRFRVILILVARQNGKSQLKRTISLWRLYMDCAKLVLGVAQDVSLAREQWQYTIDTIESSPDLSAELGQVRRFNGDEWFRKLGEISGDDDSDEPFRLTSGGRYKIAASNRKAGRGLSVDELNFDELREQRNWDAWSALSKTTMARHNSQIWAMSNAGDDESVVLNQLRDAALSGRDPSICVLEWSAEDGCELDDTAAWRQANPALGITVSAAAIRTAMTTDPPNVFRTEVLCQKVDQLDGAIDLAAWKACADPSGTMDGLRDRVAVCFDVAPDGRHATLAVAAMLASGQVRTEIVRAWDDTSAARAELPEQIAKIRPAAISWYPTGPGAAFSPMLRPAKDAHTRIQYVELAGMKVAEACQGLADLAKAGAVIHNSDPLLDSHIGGAQKLNAADGWRFTRRGGGHCDAAYAAAGAVYVALTMPAPRRARIRVLTA